MSSDPATIAAATCIVCGEGPNRLGCLIALRWSSELGGYQWAHRTCADHERISRQASADFDRFERTRRRLGV